MNYKVMTEDEQHDILVSYLGTQERDHFCHELNQQRFTAMLEDPALTPQFADRIRKLKIETESRLHEVTKIIEATLTQLPSEDAVQAAKARIARAATKPPSPQG